MDEGMQQAGSSAVDRAVAHLISRFMPALTPWAAAGLLWPAAAGTHALWSTPEMAPWAAAGLTLSGCLLTILTWVICHARGPIGRVHSTLTSALAMGWLTVATIAGPATRPTVDLWVWGGGTVALTWSVRRVIRPDGGGLGGDGIGKRWKEGLAEKLGLGGSRWQTTSSTAHRTEGLLQLEPGKHTPRDVINQVDRLASGFQVRPGGVRATPDPDRGDQVRITVVKKDLLREVIEWSAPSHPGASLWDAPIRVGVYEDGLDAGILIAGHQDLPSVHVLYHGMNGAGKSNGARASLAEVWSRRETLTWGIDVVKAEQTLGPAAEGLDWLATTRGEAEAMLEAIETMTPVRATYLARLPEPLDRWEPGCGLPFLVVLIEEAPALVADSDRFSKLAQTVRSAGICLKVSAQRASYRNMPTEGRAQLSATVCYGVRDSEDAVFALGDLVERGADPSIWKNTRPGCAYLQAPGIADERLVVPLRSPRISIDALREAARMAAGRELDPVSASGIEKTYAKRTRGADLHRTVVVPGASLSGPGDGVEEQEGAVSSTRRIYGPDADLKVDIEDEIPDPADALVFPALTTAKPTPEQARATLVAQLDLLKAEGRKDFAPRDLRDVLKAAGRSRAWIHAELNRLIEEGQLTRTDSGYYAFAGEGSKPALVGVR
jgi:hypothetical protein